jgi:hypothetical protein
MTTATRPSSRTVESLGKPIYQQKPAMANQIAGLILSALLVGGGVAITWLPIRELKRTGFRLPIFHERNMSWAAAALLFAISIALVIGGILLFRRIWSLFSFCLYVCPEGFYFSQRGERVVFAWDEIQLVEETVLHERLPLAKGVAKHLMPTKTSRSYRVVRCDGREFAFDVNTIPRVSLLSGPLTTAAKRCGFEWRTQEETR